ncbi:MAG: helix-turn-helix domain-containing protein [Rubrivivax sp.]
MTLPPTASANDEPAAADASAPTQSRQGSQSIQRAFHLLRVIEAAGPCGLRLVEIARRAGLHVATVHRLLGALEAEHAISFDPFAHLYHVDNHFLRRSEDTPGQRLQRHYAPLVQRLAGQLGTVVFLQCRQGLDALCLDRALGRVGEHQITLDIGGRRPLGVSSGSLVLLASLPADTRSRIIDANAERYRAYNRSSESRVADQLRHYWCHGYAFNRSGMLRNFKGFNGLGVPLHDDLGQVVAALSLAGDEELLPAAGAAALARALRAEVARSDPFPASPRPADGAGLEASPWREPQAAPFRDRVRC